MLSIVLWQWYIHITITIVDIIHRCVFSLKQNVSETGFCPRLQVHPTQLCLTDRANLCLSISQKAGNSSTLRANITFSRKISILRSYILLLCITPGSSKGRQVIVSCNRNGSLCVRTELLGKRYQFWFQTGYIACIPVRSPFIPLLWAASSLRVKAVGEWSRHFNFNHFPRLTMIGAMAPLPYAFHGA
jgi:hypothetical protein